MVILRVAIGWHFLFEGLSKVSHAGWSSITYLVDAGGPLAYVFHRMAASETAVSMVDQLNIWGQILIGLALILGLFERFALMAAAVMLALFYVAHPPFPGIDYLIEEQGNYFVVNMILIEFLAVWVLWYFPTSGYIGIKRLFNLPKKENHE
ncbi:MAG: hypothetical protein Kow00127_11320 [Bacteroidales bacterium]